MIQGGQGSKIETWKSFCERGKRGEGGRSCGTGRGFIRDNTPSYRLRGSKIRSALQHTRSKNGFSSREGVVDGVGDGGNGVTSARLKVTVFGKAVHRAHDRFKSPCLDKRLFFRASTAKDSFLHRF